MRNYGRGTLLSARQNRQTKWTVEDACPYNSRHTFPLGKYSPSPLGKGDRRRRRWWMRFSRFPFCSAKFKLSNNPSTASGPPPSARGRRRVALHLHGKSKGRIRNPPSQIIFTLPKATFHAAIGGISQKRRAAKNAAPDFISRCQRQHFTAAKPPPPLPCSLLFRAILPPREDPRGYFRSALSRARRTSGYDRRGTYIARRQLS